MKKKVSITLAVISVFVFFASPFAVGGHGKKSVDKTGILLVAFGTSVPRAQVAFDKIDSKVKETFPGVEVRWAYTSSMIRKKLARKGRYLDSPTTAMAKMMDGGFTHVAVQSLHTIAGYEFNDLKRNVDLFAQMVDGFKKVRLGLPLLADDDDIKQVGAAMSQVVPTQRRIDEAVVWMGHGSHHPANAFYAALMYRLQTMDKNAFVGCVEGFPEIGHIRDQLISRNIKRVYLMPFMSVAGDHARNDMAGDDEDSWQSILTKAGITCQPVLKGTAEYDVFIDIWIGHLKEAMAQLGAHP